MRYSITHNRPDLIISVEESFTLIDFMALFACLLLGVFFAMFLWIFAGAILVKLFTRREYHFDGDSYRLTVVLRIFSYIKIRRKNISFDDIDHFLFSNFDSGNALVERGLVNKEWYTLEIILKDKTNLRMVKCSPDEIEELNELYEELQIHLDKWFRFSIEYEVLD